MKVIGITGKAGSGKDTVANHLIAKYGYRREQFAYDLKRMVCETFGWDRDRIDDLEYKEEVPLNPDRTPQCPGPPALNFLHAEDVPYPDGMSRRDVLIEMGTNCMRAIDPDIHVKLTGRRVVPSLYKGDRRRGQLVFPDVRFLNEARAIREWGGEIWRTVKLGGSGTSAASAGHVSETEMDLIIPEFTLEAAHGEIDLLLEQVDVLLSKS